MFIIKNGHAVYNQYKAVTGYTINPEYDIDSNGEIKFVDSKTQAVYDELVSQVLKEIISREKLSGKDILSKIGGAEVLSKLIQAAWINVDSVTASNNAEDFVKAVLDKLDGMLENIEKNPDIVNTYISQSARELEKIPVNSQESYERAIGSLDATYLAMRSAPEINPEVKTDFMGNPEFVDQNAENLFNQVFSMITAEFTRLEQKFGLKDILGDIGPNQIKEYLLHCWRFCAGEMGMMSGHGTTINTQEFVEKFVQMLKEQMHLY